MARHERQSKPIIPVAKRRPPGGPVAPLLASLVQPAPLTLLCMACRTPRCATPQGIVLWHPDGGGPRLECAGSGAPGVAA